MSEGEMQSGGPEPERPLVVALGFAELTRAQLHDIFSLRSRVFVVEQDCVYNDVDGRDIEPETTHMFIELDGQIAAYLRVLDHTATADEAVIGRVVTHPDHRGHGLAAVLVEEVVANHGGDIRLEAQSHLEGWYSRFGFERVGDDYVEDGIAHVSMRRLHPVE